MKRCLALSVETARDMRVARQSHDASVRGNKHAEHFREGYRRPNPELVSIERDDPVGAELLMGDARQARHLLGLVISGITIFDHMDATRELPRNKLEIAPRAIGGKVIGHEHTIDVLLQHVPD